MVRMFRQQHGSIAFNAPNARRKQSGSGINLNKDPNRPNQKPSLDKTTDDRRGNKFKRPGRGEAQSGLVYVGGGFYRTPFEEVDPRDCERWPNSIWCSGLFSPDIGDLPGVANSFGPPIGAGIEFVADECNIGIEVQPYLGFVAQPTQQLVWRKPECRGARPSLNFDPSLPEPQEPWKGKELIDPYPDDALLHVIHHEDGSPPKSGFFCEVRDPGDNLWGAQLLLWYGYTPFDDGPQAGVTYREAFWFHYDKWQGRPVWHYKPGVVGFEQWEYRADWDRAPFTIYGTGGRLWTASKRDWIAFLNWRNMVRPCSIVLVYPFGACLNTLEPPPYPSGSMSCPCPSPRQQRAIAEKLEKISEQLQEVQDALGDGQFDVPKKLIVEKTDEDPDNIKIEGLTDFLGYIFERQDEIWGQWQIPIEIEDVDPNTKGNQKETRYLMNIAEAFAEVYSLCFNAWINSEISRNINTRSLIQGGQILQTEYQSYKMIECLLEWVGIGTRNRKEVIKLLFNPDSKDDINKFLSEYDLETSVLDYKPRKKETLQDDLMDIRQGIAIIRALYWARTGVDAAKFAWNLCEGILNDEEKIDNQANKREDFSAWIDNAERGFSNLPRATQGNNPYGMPFQNRPKITDITKNPEKNEN